MAPPTSNVIMLALAAAAVIVLGILPADSALSIPRADTTAEWRADQVAKQASRIANVARNITIGTEVLPLYTGPLVTPGSLAEQVRLTEARTLATNANFRPQYVAGLAAAQRSTLQTFADLVGLYDLASARLPKPIATDNSDANFGRQRLTIKAMRLRRVGLLEFLFPSFLLTNGQLAQLCGWGVTWLTIRMLKNLYVEEFADVARWNDPAKTNFIPNRLLLLQPESAEAVADRDPFSGYGDEILTP